MLLRAGGEAGVDGEGDEAHDEHDCAKHGPAIAGKLFAQEVER